MTNGELAAHIASRIVAKADDPEFIERLVEHFCRKGGLRSRFCSDQELMRDYARSFAHPGAKRAVLLTIQQGVSG